VVETRTADRLLCDADTPKGRRKQGDLQARLKIAEAYPDGIFISIHMNSYPGADCQGLQVWYAHGDPRAAACAEAVQTGVRTLLQPENHRKIKASTSGIYLLEHAPIPAILVECGFLSTPRECRRLQDATYQKQLATVIFASLNKKIKENTCAGTEVML
jgi:N-acetylmuramoyl-L-alanine amidase